ncbi:protein adenylyltransferase SelO family protein [Sphingomonas sp. ac-8]|uniref:protein adenylyltransferase SelO family protein n=1 Tax=Sphingomonas sp. ac-8 TaxID=3242977 RepID=UPI003A8031CB
MPDAPQPSLSPEDSGRYRPERSILELGSDFYDPVAAADFPKTILRYRNDRAAASVGLETLDDAAWMGHFGRFEPLPDTLQTPLALRYHGHQFRSYNPDLGDGRGFLFAQMRDGAGRLMDLGTKGSGQTLWSRFGDGRLTLKGAVREILATEMLEALGVDTSRTFSVIETGEALTRGDEPSPTRSAVMVRLSHGHIRIGSFQRLAYLRDAEGMERLVGYVLRHFYGEEAGADGAVRLLDHVVARTARLAGQYMAAGFVHGVLNTDNINVTGESFDYGPWRFAQTWDPAFTAAYFDQTGLYAFGRQPEAIYWDAMQLAVALRALADSEPLIAVLEEFAPRYQQAVRQAMLWRLGVTPRDDVGDRTLVARVEQALRESGAPIDAFFHDAFGGRLPDDPRYGDAFAGVRESLLPYAPRKDRNHPHWHGAPCTLSIEDVEAIWAPIADRDDWSALDAKLAQIRSFGQALG